MDALQAQFEQGVGDRFASWLSASSGRACRFLRRADVAPDLVYEFQGQELLVEVTAAYYDESHAEFLWRGARQEPATPQGWGGVGPDQSLALAIVNRIRNKSIKRYGANTVLLVEVPPGVTSAEDLAHLLEGQSVDCDSPFWGIYVVGTFPVTERSSGGYRVLPIRAIVT